MSSPMNMNLKYVDRPDVAETFADSMEKMTFDGISLRMEFVVNRLDEPKPPLAPTGTKITACRLILPAAALPAFASKIAMLMAALEKQGIVKSVVPANEGKAN